MPWKIILFFKEHCKGWISSFYSTSILAKAAHVFGVSRAEGRGTAELFELDPPEAEQASCEAAEKHETFGVKKSTVE